MRFVIFPGGVDPLGGAYGDLAHPFDTREGRADRGLLAPHLDVDWDRARRLLAEPRQLRGSSVGHDPALGDDHHAVRDPLNLRQQVAGQQDRVSAREVADQLPHVPDLVGVQSRGRLVQHQDRRLVQQRRGQTHPLAVALAQSADGAAP